MDKIKLILRIILCIVAIPLYPFCIAAYSLFGMAILIGFFQFITYPIYWLVDNDEKMEESLEGGMIIILILIQPIRSCLNYINKTNENE